jgi:hypothetical protein
MSCPSLMLSVVGVVVLGAIAVLECVDILAMQHSALLFAVTFVDGGMK